MTQSLLESRSAATRLAGHVVELRDLRLQFGDKHVLDGVSLVVDPQERLVIIGRVAPAKRRYCD